MRHNMKNKKTTIAIAIVVLTPYLAIPWMFNKSSAPQPDKHQWPSREQVYHNLPEHVPGLGITYQEEPPQIAIMISFTPDLSANPDKFAAGWKQLCKNILPDWQGAPTALLSIMHTQKQRLGFPHNQYMIELTNNKNPNYIFLTPNPD